MDLPRLRNVSGTAFTFSPDETKVHVKTRSRSQLRRHCEFMRVLVLEHYIDISEAKTLASLDCFLRKTGTPLKGMPVFDATPPLLRGGFAVPFALTRRMCLAQEMHSAPLCTSSHSAGATQSAVELSS